SEQAVVILHQFPDGHAGGIGVDHGVVAVGQAQGVVILLGFVQVLLGLGQVGGLVLHALVIGGLGLFHAVAVAFLGALDLLFHIGGVQRGDDLPLGDGVAHRHVDGGDFVGLDRVRGRHAGGRAG